MEVLPAVLDAHISIKLLRDHLCDPFSVLHYGPLAVGGLSQHEPRGDPHGDAIRRHQLHPHLPLSVALQRVKAPENQPRNNVPRGVPERPPDPPHVLRVQIPHLHGPLAAPGGEVDAAGIVSTAGIGAAAAAGGGCGQGVPEFGGLGALVYGDYGVDGKVVGELAADVVAAFAEEGCGVVAEPAVGDVGGGDVENKTAPGV